MKLTEQEKLSIIEAQDWHVKYFEKLFVFEKNYVTFFENQ